MATSKSTVPSKSKNAKNIPSCSAATGMMKPSKQELQETFSCLDQDGSGCIEVDELISAMEFMGYKPSKTEIKELIDEVDTDGNNKIDFDEFLQLTHKQSSNPSSCYTEVELKKAFKIFDKDCDGFINRYDLAETLTNVGEEFDGNVLTEMMEEADKNGDDLVDYEEFVKIMS